MKNKLSLQKVKRTPAQLYQAYAKGSTNMQMLADEEGVSRERIRQLLRKHNPKFKATFFQNPRLLAPREERQCPKCGKLFTIRKALTKTYCSIGCFTDTFRKAPYRESDPRYEAWHKEYQRQQSRKYYYNVLKKKPDFKEIIRKRNQAWYKKHYSNYRQKKHK